MKLCTFEVESRFGPVERLGVLTPGGRILDANFAYALTLLEREDHPCCYEVADVELPSYMIGFLENGAIARKALDFTLSYLGARADDPSLEGPDGEQLVYAAEEVRLLAPLPRPNSIRDCLAFEEHLKNSLGNRPIPDVWYEIPIYYKGNPDTVAGPGDEVEWPAYTNLLDYELEFAAVIGRTGRDIPEDEAWAYVAGYTIFNDVSARDIQMKEMQGMLGPAKGKDMDGGNILGPFLVTADEWDPRNGYTMIARVNGEEWSRGRTDSMYHDFGKIVSYISRGETLHVGDVIGSGTVGTGCGLELKRFPKPGDVIELEIEGIGVLVNRFGPRERH
jgi:2-keto-4-pentenoate hydratase/2-oxohepta-3-ene-1,7-dioic acid hydratase in catechol pathway